MRDSWLRIKNLDRAQPKTPRMNSWTDIDVFCTAAGLFVIRDIKKFFISWNVNDFVKPWLRLKWNSISKGSLYRGYNLTCSNLFLQLIPHQQKPLHPGATWHSQIHADNQPVAKNARYQEEVYSDVCLLSKDLGTTSRSTPFQSIRQIRHRLKLRRQQQGRRSPGRPKVLSSQMPFLEMQLSLSCVQSSEEFKKN